MLPVNIIAEHPPKEWYRKGVEIDCQCARCGSSCVRVECEECGGEGSHFGEELGDPLWYDDDEIVTCFTCRGEGGWHWCCSGSEWCNANPIKGRENVERGKIEWFTIERFGDGILPD